MQDDKAGSRTTPWPLRWPEGYIATPDLESAVRDNIASELDDLGKPEDLIFHHVFLSDKEDGPCVLVWGEEGSDALCCEYHETIGWKPLSECVDEEC